jgi:hypothetical protein
MGVFMAEVYMYIYNWQEKKEENQALEDFCHAPPSAESPVQHSPAFYLVRG